MDALLTGLIDVTTDNLKVLLIDTADYTFSTAHEHHDDVASGSIVATSGNLASVTATSGVIDAADVTLSSVTGDPSEALIIYKDSGTSATSDLLFYIDGISVTPNGSDITITWDSGANKIVKLG